MKKLTLILLAALANPALGRETELECLAKNVYHEARGESVRGRLAVIQVTLNRARLLGKTICQTVYQPRQFSWTTKPGKITNLNSWIESVRLSEIAIRRGWAIKNFAATYYHNHTVNPQWAPKFKKLATIGNHLFYTTV